MDILRANSIVLSEAETVVVTRSVEIPRGNAAEIFAEALVASGPSFGLTVAIDVSSDNQNWETSSIFELTGVEALTGQLTGLGQRWLRVRLSLTGGTGAIVAIRVSTAKL